MTQREIYEAGYRNGRDDGYSEQGVPMDDMPDEDAAAIEDGWKALFPKKTVVLRPAA